MENANKDKVEAKILLFCLMKLILKLNCKNIATRINRLVNNKQKNKLHTSLITPKYFLNHLDANVLTFLEVEYLLFSPKI